VSSPGKSPYSKMVNQAFAEAIPLNCQIEITYRCNHLCSFCYNSPTGAKEMTTEEIFTILGKVKEIGVLYLTMTGGEAMCHKDFYKIAGEVVRLGMALRIYSNGYLMSDDTVVEKLRALNPMEIEISLHGARPETHDELVRIKGAFTRTVTAIEKLKAAGLKVILKCPITRINQYELFEIKALADRLDCQIIFDAVITPKDDGDLDPLSLRPDDEALEKYWGEWYMKLHNDQEPPKTNHCAGDSNANCGAARSGFTIDPYGNLYPCVALRRNAGNMLEMDDPADVWKNSPVLNEVRALTVKARAKLDEHESGEYFSGFCLGVAEVQTGDPLGLYPQVELNTESVRKHYELLQIGDAPRKIRAAEPGQTDEGSEKIA
jgi:MoaA/NifB/PqqE/SkfB family radical SAM enzyme